MNDWELGAIAAKAWAESKATATGTYSQRIRARWTAVAKAVREAIEASP